MPEIPEESLERRRPRRFINVSSTHQHHQPEQHLDNPHAPGLPTGVDEPKDHWQSPRWPSNDDWKSPKFNDRVNRDKVGKFSHQWQSPRWKSKPSKDAEDDDTGDWASPKWNDNLIKHDQLAPSSGPPAAIRRKAYDMALQLIAHDAEFKEEEHDRDQSGKFTSGGGGVSKDPRNIWQRDQAEHLPPDAKHIAAKRVQKKFPTDTLKWISTEDIDRRWQDSELYIKPGGTSGERTTPIKYKSASADLTDQDKPIAAPRIDINEQGQIEFADGRHHYAAMRDAGHTHIPVAVTEEAMRILEPPRPKLRGFSRAARRAHTQQLRKIRESGDSGWSSPLWTTTDEFREEDVKRDQGGKFATQAGSGAKPTEPSKQQAKPTTGKHPGHGYSATATVNEHGTIQTNNVRDAVRALYEGKKIELDQPRQVSTLVDRLSTIAARMEKQGSKVPNFDLCNVSVKDTNLFCAETKGIPRIEMPQLPDEKGPAFQQYLKDKGFETNEEQEKASFLKATQRELVGAKVSGIMKFFRGKPAATDPPLFVSKDNYIVDGHHRWAARVGLDAETNRLGTVSLNIVRVDLPIIELLHEAEEFTGGAGHKGATAKDKATGWQSPRWTTNDAEEITADWSSDWRPPGWGAKDMAMDSARRLAVDLLIATTRSVNHPTMAFDKALVTGALRSQTVRIAFDAVTSVRTISPDGHLHVALSNISRASVNPYWGKEIPDADKLGLDPNKKYMLLRHPDELAKAAQTFNGIPILIDHKPISAEDHPQNLVVGTTGTDARWEAPFLQNSLHIWAKPAIDGIQNNERRELSCAYHYIPRMVPGVYEGKPFDGIMTNIHGNHVALVESGRVGPAAIVADEMPFDLQIYEFFKG